MLLNSILSIDKCQVAAHLMHDDIVLLTEFVSLPHVAPHENGHHNYKCHDGNCEQKNNICSCSHRHKYF